MGASTMRGFRVCVDTYERMIYESGCREGLYTEDTMFLYPNETQEVVLQVDLPYLFVRCELEHDIITRGVVLRDEVLRVEDQTVTVALTNVTGDTLLLDEDTKLAGLVRVEYGDFLDERYVVRPSVPGCFAREFSRIRDLGRPHEPTINAVVSPVVVGGLPTPLRVRASPVRSWLLLALVFFYLTAGVLVGATTVCNCTAAPTVGVGDFSDYARCPNLTALQAVTQDVVYTSYVTAVASRTFKGHACTMWRKELTKYMSFWRSVTETLKSSPSDVGSVQCWNLVQTGSCLGQPMKREGQVSRHESEPYGEALWLQSMTYTVTNCLVEDITFEQACATCPVVTANGQLGSAYVDGAGVRGHVSYIWPVDDIFADKSCSHRKIYEGPAVMLYTQTAEIVRDSKRQKDFILDENDAERCVMTGATVSDPGLRLIKVVGEPDIRIAFEGVKAFPIKPRKRMVSYSKESETVVSRIDQAQSHLQWLEDRETYRDNRQIDENGLTHCKMRSLRLSLMFALSQQSGVLAARVANYPKCALLDMHGVTGIVRQCRAVNVSFDVEMTKCGAQPFFQSSDRKFTIGRDGWTMQPFSPCFWSGSMVNFNGVTSQYHNGSRSPVNVTTKMRHYDATAQYNYTADQSYAFFHGLETQEIQSMNLMGELSGLLREESVQVLDDVLQQVKDVNHLNLNLGVFDAIKSAFFVVFCLFLVVVVVYAGHRTGCFKCCGMFCKCCCSLFTRKKNISRPAVSATENQYTSYAYNAANDVVIPMANQPFQLDYVANQDVVLPLTGTIYTTGSMPPAGAPRRVTIRR